MSNLEPIAYMRDLDYTGSYHVCAKGDTGWFPVYAEPCVNESAAKDALVNELVAAMKGLLDAYDEVNKASWPRQLRRAESVLAKATPVEGRE